MTLGSQSMTQPRGHCAPDTETTEWPGWARPTASSTMFSKADTALGISQSACLHPSHRQTEALAKCKQLVIFQLPEELRLCAKAPLTPHSSLGVSCLCSIRGFGGEHSKCTCRTRNVELAPGCPWTIMSLGYSPLDQETEERHSALSTRTLVAEVTVTGSYMTK